MQTRLRRLEHGPTGESGAVLILSLLLLMVLTLLGVAALTNSRIELQLAANDRAHKQALAAADVALSIGETVIESWTDPAELDEDAKADDGRYGIGQQPAWGYLKWDAACDGPPDTCRGGSEAVSLDNLPAGIAYVLSSPQSLLPPLHHRTPAHRAGQLRDRRAVPRAARNYLLSRLYARRRADGRPRRPTLAGHRTKRLRQAVQLTIGGHHDVGAPASACGP